MAKGFTAFMRQTFILILYILSSVACTQTATQPPSTLEATPLSTNTAFAPATDPVSSATSTEALVTPSKEPLTPTNALSETASPSPTDTPLPTVERLKAKVTADLLSCRYGPGAEYLYLYALRKAAHIELIGRTDANNWAWVDGKNKCWVNTNFLEIQGDFKSLPIVYPGIAKLPVSPYYPGPSWAKAARKGDNLEVSWEAVPISPGKYEDENMHQYIVEVWRCENGEIILETLGTNLPYITVKNDQTGCDSPSHGNVYVQEKHGYGGPVEIPWPEYP